MARSLPAAQDRAPEGVFEAVRPRRPQGGRGGGAGRRVPGGPGPAPCPGRGRVLGALEPAQGAGRAPDRRRGVFRGRGEGGPRPLPDPARPRGAPLERVPAPGGPPSRGPGQAQGRLLHRPELRRPPGFGPARRGPGRSPDGDRLRPPGTGPGRGGRTLAHPAPAHRFPGLRAHPALRAVGGVATRRRRGPAALVEGLRADRVPGRGRVRGRRAPGVERGAGCGRALVRGGVAAGQRQPRRPQVRAVDRPHQDSDPLRLGQGDASLRQGGLVHHGQEHPRGLLPALPGHARGTERPAGIRRFLDLVRGLEPCPTRDDRGGHRREKAGARLVGRLEGGQALSERRPHGGPPGPGAGPLSGGGLRRRGVRTRGVHAPRRHPQRDGPRPRGHRRPAGARPRPGVPPRAAPAAGHRPGLPFLPARGDERPPCARRLPPPAALRPAIQLAEPESGLRRAGPGPIARDRDRGFPVSLRELHGRPVGRAQGAVRLLERRRGLVFQHPAASAGVR